MKKIEISFRCVVRGTTRKKKKKLSNTGHLRLSIICILSSDNLNSQKFSPFRIQLY